MQSTPAVALPSQNATATATPRQQAISADASEDESSWSPKTSAGTTHARTPRARAEIGLLDETTLIPNPTNRAAASGDAVAARPPSAQNRYPRKTLISPPALLGGSPSWGRIAPEGTGGRPSPVCLSNGARSLSNRSQSLTAATAAAAGDHGNGVGQERHLASTLDGVRDVVLVLRAGASDAARLDLAAVGHVLAEELSVLVVDELSLLLAELAVLATRLALKILLLLSQVLLPFYWRYPRYLAVRAPPE